MNFGGLGDRGALGLYNLAGRFDRLPRGAKLGMMGGAGLLGAGMVFRHSSEMLGGMVGRSSGARGLQGRSSGGNMY